MKTIKRERQVRLDELIGYITKNEVVSSHFRSNRGSDVVVDINGGFDFFGTFNGNDIFTITEEVEITESTILEEMVIVRTIEYRDGNVQKIITLATHKSISDVKGEEDWNKKSILHEVWTVKGNGMGELIWTKERGLID